MSEKMQRDDALFEALSKTKKKRKRKIVRTVIIAVLVVAVILLAVVSHLRRQVEERYAAAEVDVLTFQAKRDTISTTVAGSGSLTQVDLESVLIPAGVEIGEILVEADDQVSVGDVLATVDMSTVMSALSGIQAELDDLDAQIGEAKGEEVSETISAGVAGRVKIIYAQEDTDVTLCMVENGALAVLSLDGYMALDLETDALAEGDAVTVLRDDGKEVEGTVDAVSHGVATILITDNGPRFNEEVTVLTEDGTELGKAALYIHNPLSVTGYAGTVDVVRVSENQKVSAGTRLFTLTDTSYSANYETLLRSRGEKEEELMELLSIYRDGAILSPISGVVSSIDHGEEEASEDQSSYGASSAASGMSGMSGFAGMYGMSGSSGTAATTAPTASAPENSLLTIYPNVSMSVTISIDETDILALKVGQEVDVTVSSIGDEVYTGTVTQIDKTANTSYGVTQYSAEVTVPKAQEMLPGMTADVEVKIEGVEDTLIVPVDAVHHTSTVSFVYTSYNEETQEYGGIVEVTTGMQNSNFVEITSGLNEGDTVYYTENEGFDFFSMISGGR